MNTNITGAAVTVSADAKAQDLTINPAGKLTLNSGKALTVKGNMLIQSDVTGTGSYIDYGTTSVTGTTTAQRYMTGNWNHLWPANSDVIWHYVSTPVSGATINTFAGGLLNSWKEDTLSTGYWKPLTLPLTIPLAVSTGYAAAMPSTGIISYTGGTFNTGDKAINNLTNSDQSASRGYNLIGNAFPSAIAWNNLISRTNLDASAYLWTGSTYATYLTDDHHRIPSEQAFFVHVTVGHSTGSLVIPNTNRVHTDTVYAKSTASTRLDLTVTGNNLEDLTSIRFNNDATTGFDPEYDAYKLWGVTACPQIYCIATDNLSINSLPEYTDKTVIPIGFKFGVNDNYTITASKLETFPGGTQIYLVDRVLHVEQDLFANPVYTFAASIGNPGHRFDIQFSPLTGIPEGSVSNINIYSANKTVYINVPMDLHGQIIVYDLLGKEVANQSIESKTLNKVSLNSQPGYYLVKVFGDKATVSGKVFIQ
ncbi:MAG: T9SS type A sorting domain-containing protein [Bacteroidota bacterium]